MNFSEAIIKPSLRRVCPLLSIFLLSASLQASIIDSEPYKDVTLLEQQELNELYHLPMISIHSIVSQADSNCNRLPSKEEFNEFILNGRHRSIQCTKLIKGFFTLEPGRHPGKELPFLPEFLKRNQYEIHSDTKTLFIILKQKPSEWKYKHFKSEDYEYVIHCVHKRRNCSLSKVKEQILFCRNSKDWAKSCYFGNKKVIDY